MSSREVGCGTGKDYGAGSNGFSIDILTMIFVKLKYSD